MLVKEKITWDQAKIRNAFLAIRSIDHSLRRRIIDIIEDAGSMTVTDLYIKLRMDQSVVSQHLAILRRAGVIVSMRKGKFIYYSLDYDRIDQIKTAINHFVGK